MVRGDTSGLLKFSREMMHRQSGNCSQHSQIYAFAQMHLYVFPYATQCASRQTAVELRWCWRRLQKSVEQIEARARMQIDVRWVARGIHVLIRWSHECRAAAITPSEQQSRRDVRSVPAPK